MAGPIEFIRDVFPDNQMARMGVAREKLPLGINEVQQTDIIRWPADRLRVAREVKETTEHGLNSTLRVVSNHGDPSREVSQTIR